MGVSVYFDGSTMGTITNEDGIFMITARPNLLAPIIFSHLGYKSRKLDRPFDSHPLIIRLKEKRQELPEVVVTSDPFSRRQKINVFRKEFLGDGRASKKCTILNEEDIQLFFNTFNNSLTATAKSPIVIVNSYLQYIVKFDLKEFTIAFRSRSLERIDNIHYTRYAGFTRFEDFANNDVRTVKRRQKAYLGSPMHFMRSLWNGDLIAQDYSFTYELKSIPPVEIFHLINESDGFKTVEFRDKKFMINYKNKSNYRSSISLENINSISIDKFGNYTPYQDLIFGGYMAGLRISEMLPMDYLPPIPYTN